jgi:tetratricopeptide (TPR) repeat protein
MRTLFATAFSIAQRIAPLEIQIKLAMQYAETLYRLLEIPLARQFFLRLQHLAQQAGDMHHLITAVARSGSLASRVGQLQVARARFEQATALLADNPELEVVALDVKLSIATMHIFAGHYQRVLTTTDEAFAMLEAIQEIDPLDRQFQQARGYLLKGYAFKSLGRFEESLPLYHSGLEIYRQLNDRTTMITACISIASLLSNLYQLDEALAYLQEAREIIEETGAIIEVAQVETMIGELIDESGDHATALDHYNIAIGIHERTHTQDRIPWLLGMSAAVHLILEQPTPGIAKAQRALQIAASYDAARIFDECVVVLYRFFMIAQEWEVVACVVGYGEQRRTVHASQLNAARLAYDALLNDAPVPLHQLHAAYSRGGQLTASEVQSYLNTRLSALAEALE